MLGHNYPSSAHRNNTSYDYLNKSMKKSNSKKHYHQQSMDDFIKNIKKYNLRSERYISSKPLLYMYARNNTTNTIDKQRSKSLSNRKSISKSKKLKKRIQKIFEDEQTPTKQKKGKSIEKFSKLKGRSENPALIIEDFSKKIGKVEKNLQKRSVTGVYLCQKFQQMLNDIVIALVNKLDEQMNEIKTDTTNKLKKKYQNQIHKLERHSKKLSVKLKQALERLQNSSKIIYHIRKLNCIDVDYIFGKELLGTEECGGYGYGNVRHDNSSSKTYSNQNVDEERNKISLRAFEKKEFEQIDIYSEKESGRIREKTGWEKKEMIQKTYEEGVQNQFQIMRKYST